MNIKLSILIPSLDTRMELLSNLVCGLIRQAGYIRKINSFIDTGCTILIFQFDEVEIIICKDQKTLSTGFKRNILLRLAAGTWVASVDDDDTVADYYIYELLKATKSNADTFAINGCMLTDGSKWIRWELSKDNENFTDVKDGIAFYRRKTNHLSPVKKELALLVGFPDKSNAEDKYYSDNLNQYLKTEHIIEPPLYTYNFSSTQKEYT